jgi:hypothetical protein
VTARQSDWLQQSVQDQLVTGKGMPPGSENMGLVIHVLLLRVALRWVGSIWAYYHSWFRLFSPSYDLDTGTDERHFDHPAVGCYVDYQQAETPLSSHRVSDASPVERSYRASQSPPRAVCSSSLLLLSCKHPRYSQPIDFEVRMLVSSSMFTTLTACVRLASAGAILTPPAIRRW